ncbi:MAG: lipid A deacylase LpxR family protein [Croceitalea sp.]|nr:lipid A deacylase LpxR family protein [Croceitalea sp.]
MRKSCLVLLFSLICSVVCGQQQYDNKIYKSQIELRHDNDFFLLTDRYYSSGLYLNYRTVLEQGFTNGGHEQFEFQLSQEIFTPSQTQSTNIAEFDRSYAGYIGLLSKWSAGFEDHLLEIGISAGIVGPSSGAGGFQRWYHNTLVISDSPIWVNELKNSFHTNIYASYLKEWKLAPNPFGVRMAIKPNIAVGSRDIFLETEGLMQFGRRNILGSTIAYNRLGSNSREIFFTLRFAYRKVFYNGLIEGTLFGDNSEVLRELKTDLYRLGFDFNHRFDGNDYKFGVRFNTAESVGSKSHKYIQLAYGFGF